jgi:hypothetical protein
MRSLFLAAALAALALPAAGQTLALTGPTGQTLSVSKGRNWRPCRTWPSTFDAHGEKHAYEGVLLIDLLAKVGTPTGKALGGKALANAVRATAADGYQVVFGWARPTPAPARTASSWRTRPTARRSATRTGRSSSWWKATCGPPAARGC